jgi:hypothetical protein
MLESPLSICTILSFPSYILKEIRPANELSCPRFLGVPSSFDASGKISHDREPFSGDRRAVDRLDGLFAVPAAVAREAFLVAVKMMPRKTDLLAVILTLQPGGCDACPLYCGDQECNEHADDGDHYQQLDERNGRSALQQ